MSTPKKYIDLIGQITERLDVPYGNIRLGIHEALAYLDRNPEQAPGRTVTEPEPTSSKKLANDIEEWGMPREAALNLAPWLVGQGWGPKVSDKKYTPDEVELIGCYAGAMEEQSGENYATAKADAERGIAKIRAEAWDEGYETGCSSPYGTATPSGKPYDPEPNPYRE